ncbi:DNA cytosine methyltransferase [Marinobacter sp.]|uniref:DNA cytosine methyltransferase n=1 Tax=Marinobacter sp. TaxID=50741 RepID=UPI000C8D8D23|nr:DNA (cytosine-5-)-methyltransferase [Marinobacter sp.]
MLDLFSGIGGFSYAGEKLVGGYETVAFCEYDKHAQKVLRKHWPDTEIIDDVRELANDAERFRGSVDIICGGYPCQPFSLAGVRRGDKDDRHLWPEMLRIIQAVRPTWVCGENVAGHISMGLDTVLSDLEAGGYQARCFVIPAVAADAHHRRDRCWVVAHSDDAGQSASQRAREDNRNQPWNDTWRRSTDVADAGSRGSENARAENVGNADKSNSQRINGWEPKPSEQGGRQGFAARCEDVPNASSPRLQGDVGQGQAGSQGKSEGYPAKCRWWEPEPAVGRVANGVSGRVHRLRQLGNSIVPQVAARILWAIKKSHNG